MPCAFLSAYQSLVRKLGRSIGNLWLILGVGLCGVGCSADMMSMSADGSADQQASGILTGDGLIQVTTTVNTYALLAQDAAFGSTQIILSPTTPASALGLKADDLLLIIQLQGVTILTANSTSYGEVLASNGTGRFEFIGVKSVDPSGTTVNLYGSCGGLATTYAASSSQVVRVPQYRSLTIEQGASLTAAPWDGKMGGVVAVRVDTTLTIDGKVNASGQGFRGGALDPNTVGRIPGFGDFYVDYNADDGGNKGEGAAGFLDTYLLTGAYGRGPPANGGGGGNRMLAGGGGGANGDNGMLWNGQGVMTVSAPQQQTGWSSDPGFVANGGKNTTSSGGGRGGYTYSQNTGDLTKNAPGDIAWGGDFRRERGGLGGHPSANDQKSRLSLGGGGGSGDNYKSGGGAGGNGGGLVFLNAATVTGSGSILANGNNGISTTDRVAGAGGGGAGGTIIVSANEVDNLTISAVGGAGGNQSGSTSPEAAGPGGGGGGGFVFVPSGSKGTQAVDGGPGGTSSATNLANFPQNGATAGGAGQRNTAANTPFAGSPFCTTSDVSIKLTGPTAPTSRRDPVTYTITVADAGPSVATNIVVTMTLPVSGEFDQATGDGWTCTLQGALLTCTQPRLATGTPSVITVQARPPLGTSAALATARVTAQSVDPNPANNIAEASIDITDPLSAYGGGGGIACQTQGATPQAAQSAWPILLLSGLGLALSLLLRRRVLAGRRQQ